MFVPLVYALACVFS